MGDEDIPTELIAGKYRLTRLLGRGGMGSVWEGVHNTLGTRVACKFIDAEYADSAEARSRFENEARAAAALRSKHVVEVYDHGLTDDGRAYIVMEYLAGEPLDARLARSGRLSLVDTAAIINQVSRALAKAHAAGIVHRDLKPENVFLVWDEEDAADIVKVVDFGIAKFTDKSVGISSATRTGSVLGTPYYMSPEQARGLRSVDFRSDLWSLGVITFRCVVGRLPFEGEALGDLLVKLCTAPVPMPSQFYPGLPPAFDAWMARALSRDPEARFADAKAMAQELLHVAGLRPHDARASHSGAEGTGQHRSVSVATGNQLADSRAGMATPQFAAGTPLPQAGSSSGAHPLPPTYSTDAALTATPPLPKRSSKVAILSGLGVLGLVGLGAAFAMRSVSADSTAPQDSAAVEQSGVEATVAAAPAVMPVPEPEAAVDQAEVDSPAEPAPADPPQRATLPAKRPVSATPRRQAVVPRQPEPAPEAVVEQPKPAPPPPPAPKPRSAPKKKPGIDVGY